MRRGAAMLLAAGWAAALACPAAAAEAALERLPGWDGASASAGCLAMAASLPFYRDDDDPEAGDLKAEGAFWTARLSELSGDPGARMEYWEAAHGWLVEELGVRSDAEAESFLTEYHGLCATEQARLQNAAQWGGPTMETGR